MDTGREYIRENNPVSQTEQEFMKRFGHNIKLFRKTKDMSQTEVAEAIGVSQATISDVENAKASLSIRGIFRIACLFETTFYDLVKVCKEDSPDELFDILAKIKISKI